MPVDAKRSEHESTSEAELTGFGVKLFLASLTALFAATLAGYLIVMLGFSGTEFSVVPGEPLVVPEGANPFEIGRGAGRVVEPQASEPEVRRMSGRAWGGLLFATAVMLASSWTVSRAVLAARRGESAILRSSLNWTLVLALVFLVAQTVNWFQVAAELPLHGENLRAWLFYALTGTHALHVLGGLVPLGIVVRRARAGRYDDGRWVPVRSVAWYWHFLDAVWIVMLATMWFAGH
jgi:cytochrome c oxidase subunit III